jgi:O-phospho-L-seryl-tRNASec:L-selenocysteinyl-tRNA synthase
LEAIIAMDQGDIQQCFQKLGIPANHTSVGLSNLIASSSQFKSLFLNRRLPDEGLTDIQIQLLLYTLSSLDSNNAAQTRRCGVGEREGRVYSSLVMNRHFGFTHGVGRSGDITEPQPKAVGSSAMAKLTLSLAMDAMRRGSGLDKHTSCKSGILLPLCTGMSVALTLQSLKELEIKKDHANNSMADKNYEKDRNIVLWCRIDQKSCFKAIMSAGMECIIIPTKRVDGSDEVTTNLDALRKEIDRVGCKRIVAVITTTSCFVPRVPDRVDKVGKVCKELGVCHLINNAYGLQCEKTCKLINRACAIGRVDAIVSSTDKNFLVPVGK